jgi:hypothetical protein
MPDDVREAVKRLTGLEPMALGPYADHVLLSMPDDVYVALVAVLAWAREVGR